MRAGEDASFRKVCLWFVIGACFVVACYLCLVSALSIFIGVKSAPQPGFWVPILAGLACLLPVLWALIRVTKVLFSHMAEKGIVRI